MNNQQALLEEDRISRERALELGSFIVEAPAGAGKTELLTQRYLRLLAVVGEPEEIVAITFTNKAAAEMRNRILTNLERAAAGDPPAAAHQRITFDLARAALAAGAAKGVDGWQLIAQPARLRILTIDALCASLARQMPFLSRFGAQPKISDDPLRHYEEAARRSIAMLDEEGVIGEIVAEALHHLDNDAVRLGKLLSGMLARRDQWLRHTFEHGPCEESERGLGLLVQRDLECAAACLGEQLQSRLMPAARYAAANSPADAPLSLLIDWHAPLPVMPEALPHWRALCELLLTKEGAPRKQYTKNNGLPPGKESAPHKQALLECVGELSAQQAGTIARIRKLPDPHYSADEWRSVEALAALLKLAAVQLWAVFNEQGEADFIEVAQRALLALGDADAPSDLALKLDYRIQHLLVDEFQDTSPTQVQLLQRLTAGWQAEDGRTLFAVGDPMQSIYRFRKADVGLFLRAADGGIGSVNLQRLRLCRNNRSCAALVDWVNQSFAKVFPVQDSVTNGAIRYRPFVATRPPLDADEGVRVHPIYAPEGSVIGRETAAEDAEAREAQRILEIISEVRSHHPARQIAVLVRARSHLDALVALIRQQHPRDKNGRQQPALRFAALEIEGLAARQPVQDLLALTRALLHRADRVHWLAILRAPWCGLTLADLHALAADDQAATLWQLINDAARVQKLSADGQQRLAHLRTVLEVAFAQQGRARLRRWVEGVWLQLGGAACLQGPAEIADAQAYLDLLDQLDSAGRFRLDRLEQDVAALYAAPDAQADGTLQFMTIHKAKGLEFDTVILPGLQRKGRSDDHELMLWEEVALEGLDEHLVAAPLRKRVRGNFGDDAPTPYDYLRLLEQERSAHEDARVLYVAATRAIRSLHLVGVAKINTEGEAVKPTGTFLDLLWDSVAGDFNAAACGMQADTHASAAGVASAGAARDASRFVPKLLRVVAPAVAEVLQRSPALAPVAGSGVQAQTSYAAESAAQAGEETADPLAASVGTLVHAYLEMIARDGIETWSSQRLGTLQAAMTLWLTQRGHSNAEAKQGAASAAAALQTTLASEAGRWVLQARPGGAAELAVAQRDTEGGREHPKPNDGRQHISTHIVDRSFVEDGQRWIIDYKTTQVEDAAALPVHAERYRPQLERYARLFAEEGLPLRLAIFYAAHGQLVELAD
ncbi:MAG: UvrD-helicase domain-containing protein [Betaproteobacteria bacterium]|nr:UvrD-helicase domain-containing protein [Betaproteobacteria bacterium]